MANLINTFVAGYSVVTNEDRKGKLVTNIALLVRDKVGKNPMIKVKATKAGSIWVDKGFTIEEVKKAYPYGTPIVGFKWGEEVPTEYGNVFKLIPVDEEEPAEQE